MFVGGGLVFGKVYIKYLRFYFLMFYSTRSFGQRRQSGLKSGGREFGQRNLRFLQGRFPAKHLVYTYILGRFVSFVLKIKDHFRTYLTFGLPSGEWYPPPKVLLMSHFCIWNKMLKF